MTQAKPTKEQLEKRREEIKRELNEVDEDERVVLDNDPEKQSIEMEQHEVSVTMEQNLHRELVEIEEKLAALNEAE